jgi:hypothetical protein
VRIDGHVFPGGIACGTCAVRRRDEAGHDATGRSDEARQHNADTTAKKAVSVSGKVSDDGKTFMSDKDNKNWIINNPEAVKGHEGHHVTVKAHLDAAKNEIRVTSAEMGKDEMKDTMNQDTMKKSEMQH